MAKKIKKEEELSIEEKLAKLEEIVSVLEDEETPLEKSLEHFENGIKLFKDCKNYLSNTEKKIQTLADNLNEK